MFVKFVGGFANPGLPSWYLNEPLVIHTLGSWYTSLTKVATIYTTADQTGVLNNPTPIEGLDWTTEPDNTSVGTAANGTS